MRRETCTKEAIAFKSLWIRQDDAKLRRARHEDTFVAVRSLSPSSYPLYQSIPVARSAIIAGSPVPASPYASRAEANLGPSLRVVSTGCTRLYRTSAPGLGRGLRRPRDTRRVRTAHRPIWGVPSLSVERLVKHRPCGIEALHMSPWTNRRQ